MFHRDINEENCQTWLKKTLSNLPQGVLILDAIAGEFVYFGWNCVAVRS